MLHVYTLIIEKQWSHMAILKFNPFYTNELLHLLSVTYNKLGRIVHIKITSEDVFNPFHSEYFYLTLLPDFYLIYLQHSNRKYIICIIYT